MHLFGVRTLEKEWEGVGDKESEVEMERRGKLIDNEGIRERGGGGG